MAGRDYVRIEKAIRFLDAAGPSPGLSGAAAHVGLSPFHFQRLFRRLAGVSPKRFRQFLALQAARRLLPDSPSLLDASLDLGLSSPGRLHDLFMAWEGMTPGEFRSGGVAIAWGVHPTPLGPALMAATGRGLCGLTFLGGGAPRPMLEARWPGASFRHRPAATASYADELARRLKGAPARPLALMPLGTRFQLQVWEALLRIPPGSVASYGALAGAIGRPSASRAVGQAVGANPIAVLIPCHRVIQASGAFGHYAGGPWRKRALLGMEGARSDAYDAVSRRLR